MAKKEIKIKLSTTGKTKTERDIKGVQQSIGGLAKSAITLAAAYKGVTFALETVKLAGKLRDLETAHKNLSKAQGLNAKTMIDEMQRATRGTVSELDLLQQANNALLLGLPVSEKDMGKLADAGRRLGRAMGIDAAMGLESLVVGMGRQSKLWLDNLGILVDTNKAYSEHAKKIGKQASALTDAEKKLAFYNETMDSVSLKMKTLGVDTETVTDKIAQASVAWEDLKLSIGKALEEPVSIAMSNASAAINNFTTESGEALPEVQNLTKELKTQSGWWDWLTNSAAEAGKAVAVLGEIGPRQQQEIIPEGTLTTVKELTEEQKKIKEIQDKILLAQAEGLIREQALLELKQQGLVAYTDEELALQKADDLFRRRVESAKTNKGIIEQIVKSRQRELVTIKLIKNEMKQTKDLNLDNLQTNRGQIVAAAQFAGQLARGVELFKGMDKFAKSVLVSLQRMAEQLASRALGGLIGGGLGFLLGGPAGWGIGANIGSGGLFGKRAEGGPVEAGRPYIVGEKRPELFIPDRGGTIMPEVGGNSLTINLNGVFHGSVDELADEIVDRSEQGFNRVAVNA